MGGAAPLAPAQRRRTLTCVAALGLPFDLPLASFAARSGQALCGKITGEGLTRNGSKLN
jgi:hypothetical protein